MKFYCAKCERNGDYFDLFITNNKFEAESFLKYHKQSISSYDLERERFWIDVYESSSDADSEVINNFDSIINIGFDFRNGFFDWELFNENFDIVDEIP